MRNGAGGSTQHAYVLHNLLLVICMLGKQRRVRIAISRWLLITLCITIQVFLRLMKIQRILLLCSSGVSTRYVYYSVMAGVNRRKKTNISTVIIAVGDTGGFSNRELEK